MDFIISQKLARQFAYDCFDVIVRDIQAAESKNLHDEEKHRQHNSDMKGEKE